MKINCWWCIHEFCSEKKHIFRVPFSQEKEKFSVLGQFCSINCCMSYILQGNHIKNQISSISLLYKMYRKFLQKENIFCITPSPPREILKNFGGDMDYKNYNQMKIKNSTNIILPPIIPLKTNIDFLIHDKKECHKIESESSKNGRDELVLKRKKPLVRKHISIQETMGLVKVKSSGAQE